MSFFYYIRPVRIAGFLFLAFLFSACSLFDENADMESLTINLPDWPPELPVDDSENKEEGLYPELSRWKICLTKSDGTSTFYSEPGSNVYVSVQKNSPFCLQAQPITFLENKKECLYFYQAGFIYPAENNKNAASWKQGFTAFVMDGLYNNCWKNGFSSSQAARYVSSFNWAKFDSVIKEKLSESIKGEGKFYNPWLCDSGKIIENLSNESFRVSLLSPSACYQLSTETIYNKSGLNVLSPFIPENSVIKKTGQISIKKDSPLLLSDTKEFGLFITYLSAKNLQIEYIYIPIYKEEI